MKLSLLVQVYNGGDYVFIDKSPKRNEVLLQFTALDIFRKLLAITSANDILHF